MARLDEGYLDPACEALLLGRLLDLRLSFLFQRDSRRIDRIEGCLEPGRPREPTDGASPTEERRYGDAILSCDAIVREALSLPPGEGGEELLRAAIATRLLVTWLESFRSTVLAWKKVHVPRDFAFRVRQLLRPGETLGAFFRREDRRDLLPFLCDWREYNERAVGLVGEPEEVASYYVWACSRTGLAAKWVGHLGVDVEMPEVPDAYPRSYRLREPRRGGMLLLDYEDQWHNALPDGWLPSTRAVRGGVDDASGFESYWQLTNLSQGMAQVDMRTRLEFIVSRGPYHDFIAPLAAFERARGAGRDED